MKISEDPERTVRRARLTRIPRLFIALAVTTVAAVGCGDVQPGADSPDRSASASAVPTTGASPAASSCAARVLAGMSRSQRVGQLFMGAVSAGPDATVGSERAQVAVLKRHDVGSVILMGPVRSGLSGVRGVVGDIGQLDLSVPHATVGTLVATDQEGGQVQQLSGAGFTDIPSAQVQGGWTASRLQQQAAGWAEELHEAGVRLDLAPIADVVPVSIGRANGPIGRYDRQFGSGPETVGGQDGAFVRGFGQAHVLTTLKHFPGLGRVRDNTDTTAGVTDTTLTRDALDLNSFRTGIAAGARFVMVSLATYTRIDPAHQAVFSTTVIDGMLRKDLGFDGVVVSDDLGNAAAVQAVPPGQRALAFLRAGGDLVVTVNTDDVPAMTSAVLDATRSDPALRTRVDASVRRVLAAKQAAGLMTCPA
ncbi:glycoside hydrolase family 3 N-terminal domain-containing protein [Streptomyces sp. MBT62]|uniref:glycoside hydrolase family 3 N-terminal domain-containing protein n=1 Tax=Streptomyces sp. MBT62 TaxID=2800410 RepID=UPI0027DAC2A0|nr:glycoside hydrolase family 3 N-terminal domain-containing protein [Streptomyces sp. MBT62]